MPDERKSKDKIEPAPAAKSSKGGKQEPAPTADETFAFRDPPTGWVDVQPVTTVRPPARPRTVISQSTWNNLAALMGCNLLVFITSVCIMVLELAAARLIAKHVGNSLYTWTSVIGVVLAGITIGNFIGGWLADRIAPRKLLGWLFLLASTLCSAVLWMDNLVAALDQPDAFDWPTWVVAQVGLVFLLPSTAMGTISPVVASLALSRSTKTGITVGNVYAWGAMGSIVGTFLAGFFLIDIFGTRAIVAMTAGTLGVMAAIVAVGQNVFRVLVIFGWLQLLLLIGFAATTREETFTRFLVSGDGPDAEVRSEDWRDIAATFGGGLHKLGLAVALRDDRPGEYHDESNYSYIRVVDDHEDGEPIRWLQLDKLIHSYYNPQKPDKLYYDYEQVYAEVTERAAEAITRKSSVVIEPGPVRELLVAGQLPPRVSFDAASGRLSVIGALGTTGREALIALAPEGKLWQAVDDLQHLAASMQAGGLAATVLDAWPDSVTQTDDLKKLVQFDAASKLLTAVQGVDAAALEKVKAAIPNAAYYAAVQQLSDDSRSVDTMFIGGGGFIFPRWIETHFPNQSRIDVAELDPAVKAAVRAEMGLPEDGETAVKTYIEDARRFVDIQLAENAKRTAAGEPEVLYDFVYGDAFNDFSVPWHLTTLEFTNKVQRLLKPNGTYLVNIIDVYPRTEFPGTMVETVEESYRGSLPEKLFAGEVFVNNPVRADKPFGQLEIIRKEGSEYTLRWHGDMSDEIFEELSKIAGAAKGPVENLYKRAGELVPYEGTLPPALMPEESGTDIWLSCPAPYQALEVRWLPEGGFVLGYRGAMTSEQREDLKKVAAHDPVFQDAMDKLHVLSHEAKVGRFLGRFINTVVQTFPNVYVYSTESDVPHDSRDTFVIVCSGSTLPLRSDANAGFWTGKPFAWIERDPSGTQYQHGYMASLLELSEGQLLTDDFAPVDNLLAPVVAHTQ